MRLYHQLHILVLDLDDRKRAELTEGLHRLGVHSILPAHTLIEVDHLLKEYPIDLIFLGDQLPKMPPLETIRELHSLPRSEKIPLIWYTQTRNPRGLADQITAGLALALWHPNDKLELDRALHRALHISLPPNLISLARRCDFFRGFSLEGVRHVLGLSISCRYEAGEVVIRRGDPADSFFVLLEGEVEVVLPGRGGRELIISVPQGHSFGEMGILEGSTRSAYCVAARESRVLEIDSKILLNDQNPIQGKVLAKIATLLASRLRKMNEAISALEEPHEQLPETEGLLTTERYRIATRQIYLRRRTLGQQVPVEIRNSLQHELCSVWQHDQLHFQWNHNWFQPVGNRLKRPLHLVVAAEEGSSYFQTIFFDLPFTHQIVARPDGGCNGTFLPNLAAIDRYLNGLPPEETPQQDFSELEHTRADVTPTTLFLVFESASGEMTRRIRDAFPEQQIATVLAGTGGATSCAAAAKMAERLDTDFRVGETLFLPNLSHYFSGQTTYEAASLFATIDLLCEIGAGRLSPIVSEVEQTARAMYGSQPE